MPSTAMHFHSGLWRFQVPVAFPLPSTEDALDGLRTERLGPLDPVLALSKCTSLLPNSALTVGHCLFVLLGRLLRLES